MPLDQGPGLRAELNGLVIKSVEDSTRTITGTASTNSPDRHGDVVDPKGAVYDLAHLSLLHMHDQESPIGRVAAVTVNANSIEVRAQLAGADAGLPYVEKAWSQIRAGLVRGLSIGFMPLEYEPIRDAKGDRTGGYRFKKWQWLELSAVTIPANAGATMATVKRLDTGGAWATAARHDPGADLPAAKSAAIHQFSDVRVRAALALEAARRAIRG